MVFTNLPLTASLLVMTAVTIYLVLDPSLRFQQTLQLLPAPDYTFRLVLLGFAAANCIVCVCVEDLFVERVLAPGKWLPKAKKKPFQVTLKQLDKLGSSWPPISSHLNPNHSNGDPDTAPAEVRTSVNFEIVDEKDAFQSLFITKRFEKKVHLSFP